MGPALKAVILGNVIVVDHNYRTKSSFSRPEDGMPSRVLTTEPFLGTREQ